MKPLNQTLYDRIKAVFGRVTLANEGEAFVGRYYSEGTVRKLHQVQAGEYYRVNCPFCHRKGNSNDGHQKLWINHRWGVPDDYASNWHLASCYKTECLKEPAFRKELRDLIYTDFSLAQRRTIQVAPGEVRAPLSQEVNWPGICLPLASLPADHPALTYIREVRRFNPLQIAQRYGVRFCVEPDPGYAMAVNRIVCPVYMGGKMVSWQARYVGDLDWKGTGVPKYYNLHGASKSATIYDFDYARTSPILTIVEGPTSAWRQGTGAGAILGRTLSETQVNLICAHWKAAILALDADAIVQSEAAVEKLRRHIPTVMLQLPPGFDPDTMPHDAFWDLVFQSSRQQGVDLFSFLGAKYAFS